MGGAGGRLVIAQHGERMLDGKGKKQIRACWAVSPSLLELRQTTRPQTRAERAFHLVERALLRTLLA